MTGLSPTEDNRFVDLSYRLKLRLTGSDALRYLNGQISNDLRKASETSAIQASVLNAKGRIQANVFISVDTNSFLLDADPEVRNELPPRLERYIVADDVQIEDVTDDFTIFHLWGEPMPASLSAARIIEVNRFGQVGKDIWVKREDVERTREQLLATFAFCDEECAEVFRIERGIPRWGHELTDQIIPTEANLERSSIDYTKGCYIGQEVISRIKMSGQTNKRLCGLVSVSGAKLRPAMRLFSNDDQRNEVGWITSAIHSARLGKEIALGYLKRGFETEGALFQAHPSPSAGEPQTLVEVVTIPFVKV